MSDAPIVTLEGGRAVYRASALGSCPRAFWYARHGFDPRPPPPALQEVFDFGHIVEDRTLEILAAKGFTIIRRQEEVNLPLTPVIALRGHIDGITIPLDNTPYLVEIKGFGKDLMAQFERSGLADMPGYLLQVSAYCHALSIPDYFFVLYDKDHDGEDLDPNRVRVAFNPTPLLTLPQITDLLLEREREAADPINRPACTLTYPCPYFYLHDDERPDLTPAQELLARGYLSLGEDIRRLEERRASIRDRLLAQLDRTASSDRLTVSVVSNPDRFDQRKARSLLAEAGIPLADFTIPGQGHHIRVSAKDSRAPSATPDP